MQGFIILRRATLTVDVRARFLLHRAVGFGVLTLLAFALLLSALAMMGLAVQVAQGARPSLAGLLGAEPLLRLLLGAALASGMATMRGPPAPPRRPPRRVLAKLALRKPQPQPSLPLAAAALAALPRTRRPP